MTKVIGRVVDESSRSHDIDMRGRVKDLKSFLETPVLSPATTPLPKSGVMMGGSSLGSDPAAFTNAGSELSQTADATGVRMDKVASVQAALAAGTYKVPAVAVASRVVDTMRAVKRPG
jgi:negative regulator of flagellin synthesis FlgM